MAKRSFRTAMGVARAIVAGVVVAQLASVAQTAAARNASAAGSSAEIAFVSSGDGNHEIYAVDPQTSRVRRLTHTQWDETGPAWSPDRSKLAFFVSREEPLSQPGEIWTMNADGSDAKLLRSGLGGVFADVASPDITWAPDGSSLAFSFHRRRSEDPASVICGEVWVMGSDGSNARRLLAGQPNVTGLDWSPDGERIVYGLEMQSSCQGRQGLWTMNLDGSDQRSLEASLGRRPSWSPDGTTIAFDDWRNTCHACGEVWLMDADGSYQRPLVLDRGSSSWAPSWSPDGSWIAFERYVMGGGSELWAIRADASGIAKLSDNGWDLNW